MKGMKLHGKMMLADGARSIIGSVNLAPGSFDARRELGLDGAEFDFLQHERADAELRARFDKEAEQRQLERLARESALYTAQLDNRAMLQKVEVAFGKLDALVALALAEVWPTDQALVQVPTESRATDWVGWLAEDRDSVRRRFWIKFKQVVAKLPFAEDLLANIREVVDPASIDIVVANHAETVAGMLHLMHGLPGATSYPLGMLRMVACVSVLMSPSHFASPHHGEMTKPGRPSMICLNSS